MQPLNDAYRAAGVPLPKTLTVSEVTDKADFQRALVLCPPSAAAGPWIQRFGDYSDAFASGWMQLRGARRRGAYDRGFVLSDHADWPGLNAAIRATGAERVFVTHGYTAVFRRWLEAQGYDAGIVQTEYQGEGFDAAPPDVPEGVTE